MALLPGEGSIIFAFDPSGHYHAGIYVIDADGVRHLTAAGGEYTDSSPAWSPDGEQIAFISHGESDLGNVYLMNADGTGRRKLTDLQHGVGLPSWSPDGTRIAFQGRVPLPGTEPQTDVFVINVDGSGLANLTNTIGDEGDPAWSPDGRKIAFASWEGICVMNTDGTDRKVIAPDGKGRSGSAPDWSPDGQQIAFHSFVAGTDWQIYRVDADGSNLVRLTNLDLYGVSCPTWSPDGRRIAFEARGGIYVLDIASGNVSSLVPGWKPDWHR